MVQVQIVKTLTTAVLKELSPEEVFLVEDFDPALQLDGETSSGPQGFGAEAAIAMLLPFVYRFFEKLVDRLASRAGDGGYDLLLRWFRVPSTDDDERIIDLIRKELRLSGLNDELANKAAPVALRVLREQRGLVVK
ncbi:hypothetical protein E4Q23_19720 [Candidatus Accumulibacter phosphatis]|jgi:hypothetical protein|uniref:Uncharacterized protein n=1 Tax=Candidatus Accumulibacter phosphatis TaxID=327160 RepID=A0ABX1U3T2_9PROT|nr:hypothetical protein [Candidatus Accumulibacter phosphatis]NMQ29794.1 hypothetical protein [Candidatus Accumulibacter phosphatis]